MRSPGFESRLSGWEPDVLTKIDYDRPCFCKIEFPRPLCVTIKYLLNVTTLECYAAILLFRHFIKFSLSIFKGLLMVLKLRLTF